jgi:hypothetical protein
MFFTECAHLAEQHPDLASVLERLDSQLGAMGTAEVIRSDDLASFLKIDPNQMRSALDMFALEGVLQRVEMIECMYCQMPALRSAYQEGLDEDDEYRCTSCDRPLTDGTIEFITTYRCGEKWQAVSKPRDRSGDTGVLDQAGIGTPSQTALKVPRTMGSDAAVEALLALKGKRGWTMEELARAVGTTARTLQGFKNRRTVRSSVFRTMADRLGISPEDLLGGNIPGIK